MQKTLTLKNGLKLLFIEEKSTDVVALGISVGAGVYFEKDGQSGISHLLEHLIGRSNIGQVDFKEIIYKAGGILDASTSIFKTYYYLTCLEKDFENLSDLFIKGIFNSQLTEKDLTESKESIVSELAYMEDIEEYKILREMMWKDPKLSKSITGSKDSILSLSLSDIQGYYAKHYGSQNTSVVLLASNLPSALIKTLETISYDNSNVVENVNTEINKPTFRIIQERNLKTALALCFPTRGLEGLGEERHYFNLAATAFSDLYVSKLGSKGLIYDESWVWNIFPQNGDFLIFLGDIEHNHLPSAVYDLVKLIDKWINKPLNSENLQIMKNHKILDLRTRTSIFEKITLLTKSFSTSNRVHTYEEAIKVYEKANSEDVSKSFKNILLTKKPFIVVSAGVDSDNTIGEVGSFLDNYYR